MIMETEQQVAAQQPKPEPEFHFAKVEAVHSDGLSLYIGSETTPTKKHYKCNTTCKFSAGQKVYIQKAGGEYVVLFPIGNPATEIVVDRASTANSATTAERANTANSATTAKRAEVANSVQSNDLETDHILLSANPEKNHYFAWSPTLGWRQID